MNVSTKINKMKGLWDCEANAGGVLPYTWPPRSYTCSFCKREFRCAQALGGHMNVHRRDRARLIRQYSPPPPPHHQHLSNFLSLNTTTTADHQENPNHHLSFKKSPINLSSYLSSSSRLSSPSTKCPPPHDFTTSRKEGGVSPSPSPSPSPSQMSHTLDKGQVFGKINNNRGTKRVFELENMGTNVNHKAEIVRLELEIGVLGGQDQQEHQDLDLELRLGYA